MRTYITHGTGRIWTRKYHAFAAFLEHREPDRPFVLAGFSQGAKAVVELLKIMPEDAAEYLVAAYVLSYKVTPSDVLASDNIRAAEGASDTGVTVCYNSVSDMQQKIPPHKGIFCVTLDSKILKYISTLRFSYLRKP